MVVFTSILTCPLCGAASEETMPAEACVYFFECRSCRARLRPSPGDCCVFCSFGSEKCPSRQAV